MQKEAAPTASAQGRRAAAEWAAQGQAYSQQDDWLSAAQCYRRAIDCCPTDAHLHFCLGVVLDRLGQPEAAIQTYQQAIALQPSYVEAYSNLGCVLVKRDRSAEAIQTYQQAIALQPDWATLHNNLGQAYLAQGKIPEAIAAYRQAIHHQPEMGLAHRNLGIAWRQQQEHGAAVACLQQAIALNPDDVGAIAECGSALLALGDWQQAMTYWRRAIAPHTAWIDAYCCWAETRTEADSLTQARLSCSRFLRALQRHSYDRARQALIETCLHLGSALMQYGSAPQAEAYYQLALQLQPHDADLLHRLGHCLAEQQRSNAAILVYHLAIATRPQPHTYFALGSLLEQQQHFERAIDCYQQAWTAAGGIAAPGRADPPQKIYRTVRDWAAAGGEVIEVAMQRSSGREAAPSPFPSSDSGCAGLNCAPCLNQIRDCFQFTHAKGSVRVEGHKTADFPALPTFVATLPQGRAWAVPQQSWWQECRSIAVLTATNQLLADLSRDYPGQLPGCQRHDPARHRVFTAALPPVEPIAGSVAVLAGLSGHVYFHWLVDILPRIALLQQSRIKTIDRFWVNSIQQPFQRETLQALGVPLGKVLESDRHPHIQAEQLIAPSFAGHLGWLEPWAVAFLRETFLPRQRESGYPDRLYISRQRAHHRRVVNEAAVIDCLHSFGFAVVEPELLSVAAQAALFAHARVIVAPHGSGLANMLFCQPQTTVIELVSPHYVGHYYWAISHQLSLRHYYVPGDALCDPIRQLMYQNPLTEDLWINLRSLTRLLQDVLAEGRGEPTDDAELLD